MSKKDKREARKEAAKNAPVDKTKVKMKFKVHQYYNDLKKPIFEAGKVYELEGADWIQRWVKRGGEIVEGTVPSGQPDEPNPSTIVPPKDGEQDGDKTPENGETTLDAGDQGKADGESDKDKTPDANEEETDAE